MNIQLKWKRIDIGSPHHADWELRCPCCGDLMATVKWYEIDQAYGGCFLAKKLKLKEPSIYDDKSARKVREAVNKRLEELLNK